LAAVRRDDEELPLGMGESVNIPRGAWHRVKNPGGVDLIFIEVQTGEYFGEDDIERREDDYGRV
jgi:mannose-6-phosphate isomerase